MVHSVDFGYGHMLIFVLEVIHPGDPNVRQWTYRNVRLSGVTCAKL